MQILTAKIPEKLYFTIIDDGCRMTKVNLAKVYFTLSSQSDKLDESDI